MRNFSYYGLLKIAQQASASDAYKQKRIAEMKAKAEAARRYGTTTVTHDGNTTTTTTHAHLYLQPDGSYSDKPAFTFNDDDTVTKNQPQTPAPSPAPAPSAPSPTPAAPAQSAPTQQQPAAPTPQQPGSQPVKNPAQPAAQTNPQPQQPSYRQQAWNNMDQGQRDAFRNWAQKDGRGKTFGAMFRGADGKVDQAAADKFLQDNPNFLTGTDADRDAILKKRYGQLSQDQANAFKQSKEYKDYRSAATARQQAKQQAQQAQVDANVGAYDKRQAQLQKIYDDPVGATQNWAAGQMRAGVSAQSAADSTVQAWRNARDELEKSKGFASWVDPRTGKVVSSAGGNVERTLAANRPAQPRPVRNPASYNTGGGLPGSLAGTKAKPAPKPGITTVADRGGSPSLYRMKGRTRLYNRG